jgi:hypothetical protein
MAFMNPILRPPSGANRAGLRGWIMHTPWSFGPLIQPKVVKLLERHQRSAEVAALARGPLFGGRLDRARRVRSPPALDRAGAKRPMLLRGSAERVGKLK